VGAIALVALILLQPLGSHIGLSTEVFTVLPTEVFIFAVFALTYDLIFGFTGLVSFGQALFVGCGAYALTIAMTEHGLPLWLGLLITVAAGVGLSAATGLLALRTRGVYFAMITLAFAEAAFTLAQSDVGNLTGGDNGMSVNGVPTWVVNPLDQSHLYYIALGFLVLVFLLLKLMVASPAGRVWQAIRDNEQRALMIGYRPYPYKLAAYIVSGTICSLAGALYAIYIGFVSPGNLSADLTIQLLLMVIIGGAGSLWGAILGAAILRYLNYYLGQMSTSSMITHLPPSLQQTIGQPLLILGVIYLLLIYFFPQGIAGLVQRKALFRSSGSVGLGSHELALSEPPTGELSEPSMAESTTGG
jgi:branched-chain amino acid transport system permease protein